MRSRLIALTCLALLSWLGACSDADQRRAEAAPAAKADVLGQDYAPSLEALGDSVSARARRGDTTGLLRLIVGEADYRKSVYPVSPSYDSTREEVFRFVLGMHAANSAKGLRRLLADIRDTTNGPALRDAFRETPVPGGILHEAITEPGRRGIRLFGSALCTEGRCRVLSFARAGAQRTGP